MIPGCDKCEKPFEIEGVIYRRLCLKCAPIQEYNLEAVRSVTVDQFFKNIMANSGYLPTSEEVER